MSFHEISELSYKTGTRTSKFIHKCRIWKTFSFQKTFTLRDLATLLTICCWLFGVRGLEQCRRVQSVQTAHVELDANVRMPPRGSQHVERSRNDTEEQGCFPRFRWNWSSPEVMASRLNIYRDGSDWKPYHHDSHASSSCRGVGQVAEQYTSTPNRDFISIYCVYQCISF